MRTIFSLSFWFFAPSHSHIVRGTVYTECVYTVLPHENYVFYNFRFSAPCQSHIVRGTVYTELVYTVPVAREPYFL